MLITTQVLCMKKENDSSFHILFKRVFVDKEWPKTNYMADLSIKFFWSVFIITLELFFKNLIIHKHNYVFFFGEFYRQYYNPKCDILLMGFMFVWNMRLSELKPKGHQ
jgi:hypothetical protein